jgi:hypothetical protein
MRGMTSGLMMLVAHNSLVSLSKRACLCQAFLHPSTSAVRTFSHSKVVTMAVAVTSTDEKLMKDMLYRVRQVNRMTDDIRRSLLDFRVDGKNMGKVRDFELASCVQLHVLTKSHPPGGLIGFTKYGQNALRGGHGRHLHF